MRRTRWSRAFSVVMAVWLALSLSEPAFLHACPVHGVGPGAHSAHSGALAHSADHHNSVDSTAPAKQDRGGTHNCTCIGSCCCAPPIALAGMRVGLALSESVTLRDTGLPAHAYVPVARQHVLPFQNGPPAVI